MSEYVKTYVSLDCSNKSYPAWVNVSLRWNGWLRPLFTEETVRDIADDLDGVADFEKLTLSLPDMSDAPSEIDRVDSDLSNYLPEGVYYEIVGWCWQETPMRATLVQLQLVNGNVVYEQAIERKELFECVVQVWQDLEKPEFVTPLLEKFMGKSVDYFSVGDACEFGPFLQVSFKDGSEENIAIYAVDAYTGEDLWNTSHA